MTPLDSDTVLLTFLLFCRIGGCLMFMPGFSSSRVPMQVRVFLALSVTLALAPILLPPLAKAVTQLSPQLGLQLVVSETMIGALIGLMGRMFFLALDFMGTAAGTFLGLSNVPGIPLETAEPNPTLSALATMTATVLFFSTDLHWEVLRGLVQFSNALSAAFVLALQISAPFIIYSISINLLFGIMNKLAPQIAVYFISLPFVVLGGLILMYFTFGEFMKIFMTGFAHWLITG